MTDVSRETPPAPEVARGVFGAGLPRAERFADLLATRASVRGLIGPREVGRIWERHLLNCALVSDLIEPHASVADLGSGAGLPGLVLAIRRPDLALTLVEPMERRTAFCSEVVEELGLTNVEVLRARAEHVHGQRTFDVVTSRALAPLERLAEWSLPLTRAGGSWLPMKGSGAAEELNSAASRLRRLGAREWTIARLGVGLFDNPVVVVSVVKSVDPHG